jgi:hypothetical protein
MSAQAAVVHGSICCAEHGCAVSCVGDNNDDILIGHCPHDGAIITMGSPKYFRDHAAGIAAPFDRDKAIAKHQNKAIAHMFEEDGVTLKEEFREPDPVDVDPGEDGVTMLEDDGSETPDETLARLRASLADLPAEDRELLLGQVERRKQMLAAQAAREAALTELAVPVSDPVVAPEPTEISPEPTAELVVDPPTAADAEVPAEPASDAPPEFAD